MALDELWQRVKRLNRYVQDEEPWKLSKDEAAADRLDGVLYGLAEGMRVVSVLLHPFMPGSAERLLAALGREDRSLEGAALRRGAGWRHHRRISRSSSRRSSHPRLRPRPESRSGVIDTHCHLDACEPPDAELVAAGARGGSHAARHRRHAPGVDSFRAGGR